MQNDGLVKLVGASEECEVGGVEESCGGTDIAGEWSDVCCDHICHRRANGEYSEGSKRVCSSLEVSGILLRDDILLEEATATEEKCKLCW